MQSDNNLQWGTIYSLNMRTENCVMCNNHFKNEKPWIIFHIRFNFIFSCAHTFSTHVFWIWVLFLGFLNSALGARHIECCLVRNWKYQGIRKDPFEEFWMMLCWVHFLHFFAQIQWISFQKHQIEEDIYHFPSWIAP